MSQAKSQQPNEFQKKGSWFCDKEGRYVQFRGVNFASRSKLAPYLPIAPLGLSEISMADLENEIKRVNKELDLLKKYGFNIVRLLTIWKAIEPRPNPNLDELLPEGKIYLTKMSKIMDALHARRIYVFLDFHQDLAHDVYGGDGFPDWALAIDENHPKPIPTGFSDKMWHLKYFRNESLRYTYESFWKNDLTNTDLGIKHFPVRTHLEKTIGQTAKFFKSLNGGQGHASLIGIEPFNEPYPGVFSDQDFESNYLYQFYRNVNSEVKRNDDNLFVLFEPQVVWNVSVDPNKKKKDPKEITTYLPEDLGFTDAFEHNGIFSFHYYDKFGGFGLKPENMEIYKSTLKEIFMQVSRAYTNRGLIPFLTEFGGTQASEHLREHLKLVLDQIESNFLNFTIWNYDLYHTEEGKDNWNFENFSFLGPNRKPRNLDVVVRPYPMRSSAKPSLIYFNSNSKQALIKLEGKVCEAPTIIYVPHDVHYQTGFTVWSTGEKLNWDKESHLLYWYPAKDQEVNQIIISKDGEYDPKILPDTSLDMGGKGMFSNTFT